MIIDVVPRVIVEVCFDSILMYTNTHTSSNSFDYFFFCCLITSWLGFVCLTRFLMYREKERKKERKTVTVTEKDERRDTHILMTITRRCVTLIGKDEKQEKGKEKKKKKRETKRKLNMCKKKKKEASEKKKKGDEETNRRRRKTL
jgi:hypothetical protein